MSKEEKPVLDKTEKQRQEREERLKELKDKDGSKKKLRTDSRFGRILFPIVIVAVVVGVVIGTLNQFGIFERSAKPMKVGDESISMAEYRYHYNMIYNQYAQYASYGIVATNALGYLDLDAPSNLSEDEGMTMGEFIHQQTQDLVQRNFIYAALAEEEGYELNEEYEAAIENFFSGLNASYPEALNRQSYYDQTFGKGTNENTLRPVLERALLASYFANEYPATYEITDEEISADYAENSADYDAVDYRAMIFEAELPTDRPATEEEIAAAVVEVKAKAEEMLAEVTDEKSFADAALKRVPSEEKGDYQLNDSSLHKAELRPDTGHVEAQDWLFDEARQAGDKAVVSANEGETQYVLYFLDRYDEAFPTVRHMLFAADSSTATEEEVAAAREAAEQTMAEIKSYEDMVSVGDELLAAGEVAESTEYEVSRNQMVEPFEAWSFDPDRQPGDMAVVDTSFGSHIMYFVSHSEDKTWERQIEAKLRTEAFDEDSTDWMSEERFAITVNERNLDMAEPGVA